MGPNGHPAPLNPRNYHWGAWQVAESWTAAARPLAHHGTRLCDTVLVFLTNTPAATCPGNPKQSPGKGVTWEGQRGQALPSGLPGPTDKAKPVPNHQLQARARVSPEDRVRSEGRRLWDGLTLGPSHGNSGWSLKCRRKGRAGRAAPQSPLACCIAGGWKGTVPEGPSMPNH